MLTFQESVSLFIKTFVKPFESPEKLHKGSSGRIAFIGGCDEYIGAPSFAALSSLFLGCDYAYVLCLSNPNPIRMLCPDAVVIEMKKLYEIAREFEFQESGISSSDFFGLSSRVYPTINALRVNALSIGSGLGRSLAAKVMLYTCMKVAQHKRIPMVVDGDGITLLCDMVRDGWLEFPIKNVDITLTPNFRELLALCIVSKIFESDEIRKDDHKKRSVEDIFKEFMNISSQTFSLSQAVSTSGDAEILSSLDDRLKDACSLITKLCKLTNCSILSKGAIDIVCVKEPVKFSATKSTAPSVSDSPVCRTPSKQPKQPVPSLEQMIAHDRDFEIVCKPVYSLKSPCRAAGQGDIIAGAVSTVLASLNAIKVRQDVFPDEISKRFGGLACASILVSIAAVLTYHKYSIGLTTSDILKSFKFAGKTVEKVSKSSVAFPTPFSSLFKYFNDAVE
ncbi:ATP-dependent (S)-NAD(P)H-hydrate dehydratase like protein [Aduncisulcus paluster]|uniref:ATP-dependent (S)-NAD(P)H-hydrate dehydratase n=1 Tax=Aduncisulcus paluster TaxID=2918883 RepID=A0ABQ5K440_9EUKA|nr:ATP-dependent (S)-NAD(P)H-hydrate dehydratase like protein [Aduncisulcus paluster]